MKKLVIIPGGFHPFHAGHKALYDAAREAFPSADVYIAATTDTSTRPFPFEVKKKLARIAGVDGHRFIQVKSPFRAEEITQHYDPANTQLIFVRSEKDQEQQPRVGGTKKDGSPAYLQPYRRNGLQPMNKHGYMTYLPTVQFGPGMTSATEIRAKWPGMDDEQKTRLVQQLYPDTVQKTKLADVIVKMLDEILGKSQQDENLNELDLLSQQTDYIKMPDGNFIETSYRVTDKVSDPSNPYVTNAELRWVTPQEVKTLGLDKKVNDTRRDMRGNNVFNLDASLVPSGVRSEISQWVKKNPAPALEAVLVNDPDAGHQIRPDGGMGTWDEASMVSNLARKFAEMVNMVKGKNYSGLQHVLYQGGVVKSLVDALAEYERFMQKQGRRPIARGREIDMSKSGVEENQDYVDEVMYAPNRRI